MQKFQLNQITTVLGISTWQEKSTQMGLLTYILAMIVISKETLDERQWTILGGWEDCKKKRYNGKDSNIEEHQEQEES